MTINDICKYFNKNNFNWWIDSGTLLGIVRDNKLLENDKDIDISLIDVKKTDISKILEDPIFYHYRKVKYMYRNKVYKIKFIPKNSSFLKIDINIFSYDKNNRIFFTPQAVKKKHKKMYKKIFQKYIDISKGNTLNHKKNFFNLIMIFFSKIINIIYNNRVYSLNIKKLEYRYYDIYFWFIPEIFISEFTKIGIYRVPKGFIKYLEYRYGNWRIPNKNWIFTRDDNGLNLVSDSEKDRLLENMEEIN